MGQKLGVSEENGRDKIRNVDPFIIFSFLIYGKTSEMPKEKRMHCPVFLNFIAWSNETIGRKGLI